MPALSPSPPEGTERDPDALSAAFEATLSREQRRRGGVFNTPMAVASSAVAAVIDRPGTVCDPSCGTGTFLIAAAERLVSLGLSRADAASLLAGVDIDPAAIAIADARVREWSGGFGAQLRVGDGLRRRETFDFVVGNPPFVDRLHARFLALAATTAERSVAMVLPRSVLATNDGRVARDAVVARGFGVESVTRLGPVFDASVDACIVVLRRDAPVPCGPTWSSLLVDDVPAVELDGEPLGATCEVAAGFRQHYYGLRGHVREGGDGLPLVTSGSIEPVSWGGRAVRFDGQRFDDPRVSLDDVDEPVRSWFRALLRPKVVVATQTRIVEAAVDDRGVVVPSVPVISVVPADPARLWHVLAVLLAPPVSAWAVRSWGGTALSSSAVKLGAPQVRAVPTPKACGAWDDAAKMLRRGGSVRDAGQRMCDAYGVGEEVLAWWAARLR
jgi:predicted RNA methylase